MKKLICILAVLCCAVSLSAIDLIDISGDVGIGYMNYAIVTKYKTEALSKDVADALKAALGDGNLKISEPRSTDTYNALAIGLSLKVSYFYMNLNVGLPSKQIPTGYDPLGQELKAINATDKIKGSIIADLQLGGGITLLKSTPLNIFVGGAVSVNYIRTKRELPKAFIDNVKDKTTGAPLVAASMQEIRSIAMLGVGADIAVKYFFTKNVGVCLDIKDSLYFAPLMNTRHYEGKLKNGWDFTYTITNEKSIKSLIKSQWANNFTARLGIAFKL